jgi:hypothetical protein
MVSQNTKRLRMRYSFAIAGIKKPTLFKESAFNDLVIED